MGKKKYTAALVGCGRIGYTLGLDVDSTVPVKQVCSYDYCSKNKELYRLVIPQTA